MLIILLAKQSSWKLIRGPHGGEGKGEEEGGLLHKHPSPPFPSLKLQISSQIAIGCCLCDG